VCERERESERERGLTIDEDVINDTRLQLTAHPQVHEPEIVSKMNRRIVVE
jgi:hypothetical protein